jgi:glyoxylate reductase
MRKRIYASRRIPARVRVRLEQRFDLTVHESELPPSHEQLRAACRGSAGLVTMLTDRIDDEVLRAAGRDLRVVANYAVGWDNVDLDAATSRGVLVTNTPDVLTEATAEFTIALVLVLLRRVAEGDRFLRGGQEWAWAPTFMLGEGLAGRVLGIVGLGRIGREVARRAETLGMKIVYTNRGGPVAAPYEWLPLEDVLARADIVSLHCPLTRETHHLLGRDEFRAMRTDAFLVNTARGPVVDEDALVAALREGEIAGAALDVFEHEPAVPAALLEHEKVVLAPHLASATRETREQMGMLCADALEAVLVEGRLPANAVNPEVWEQSA